jgi:hypothetical protein
VGPKPIADVVEGQKHGNTRRATAYIIDASRA